MEHDDLPYHDLLGTGPEPVPGPDELRSIVARAGRRRRRALGAGVAAALAVGGVVGGVVGYSTSNHSKGSIQTASSPSAPATGTYGSGALQYNGALMAPSSSSASAIAAPAMQRLTAMFTRSANGVDIRTYQMQVPIVQPMANCQSRMVTGHGLQAELSTSRAVGIAGDFAGNGLSTQTQIFGVAEGSPTAVVISSVGNAVAEARMAFTGGASDQMKPIGGWVVLAGPVPATVKDGVGTLTTYAASGKRLSSQSVQFGVAAPDMAPPLQCGVPCSTVVSPPTSGSSSAGHGIAPTPAFVTPCTHPMLPPTGSGASGGAPGRGTVSSGQTSTSSK